MTAEKQADYLKRLKSELSPALGCTEPAAVALATAYAARLLGEPVESVSVQVSEYIYKNGMNVGVPGSGMVGLPIAVALGALSACPERQLMVLNGLTTEQIMQAKQLEKERRITVGILQSAEKIAIEVCASGAGHTARAVIRKTHTGLALLELDGQITYQQEEEDVPTKKQTACVEEPYSVTLEEIVIFSEEVPAEELRFLQEVLRLNRAIAQEGLAHNYGLRVGKSLLENNSMGLLSVDIGNYAVACTAAAADARMAGCDKPVMSTAGSGNQGLTASVPVAAVGEKLGKTQEQILRALAVSILVTIHAKHYIGRLSALCGCSIAAAIGTCCGVISLMGGSCEQMQRGINSMVADISGVVCDGAKPGCALKIATAVSSAIRSASMAMNGLGANSHDGIVTADVEQTLANLGILGNRGMADTNAQILEMMLNKQAT